MERAAFLRPFNHYPATVSHQHLFQGSSLVPMHCTAPKFLSNSYIHSLTMDRKFVSFPITHKGIIVSCTAVVPKSDVTSESSPKRSLENHAMHRVTFPNGIQALIQGVCAETEVAEVKLKVGDFEMHLKRNIGSKASTHVISPTIPPPIPTGPMDGSASAISLTSPKSSFEKTSPFINVSPVKASKLASLEASGSNGYVLVSSPTVGSFRRGRKIKGKRQAPICKEGDVIKEGQVVGYLDQFGTDLPVRSDVAGEVLRLLFDDGEAVGYGDPLMAVLPSFHSIKI